MIQLRELSLRFGNRLLFEDVSLSIHDRQKVALVGNNGSGKSSLFAMLLGRLESTGGELLLPKDMRLAHVAQETPALEISALDYVLQGDKKIYAIKHGIDEALLHEDYEKLADLHVQFAEVDGYSADAKAAQLLDGLGFSQAEHTATVASFSGGWRVRLNLAQALMAPSDCLLLDEPTNHLDINAIIWLEKWLQQYPGTILLISHDRAFLDNVVDHTALIKHQTIKIYTGNYSRFEKTYNQQLALQEAAFAKQQHKIKHMMKFVDKFKAKASKAKQAQSRLKHIDRMELIAAVQAESEFNFEFSDPGRMPNPILSVRDLSLGYGDTIVLEKVNLQLNPGERIGLLGVNGAGKSTFIKGLIGELSPLSGERAPGNKLKIGYFAQHQIDYLRADESPLEHLQSIDNKATVQACRNYLGGFAFTGDMAVNPITKFSGGEKSRLALALIIWQKPHLLLLDEPTNHLDMDMRNALAYALQSFQGAMVLVSHDRSLLENTTDRLFIVSHHTLSEFDGDLDDYRKIVLNQVSKKPGEKKAKAVSQHDNKKAEQLEKKVIKLAGQLKELEEKLANPTLYEPEQAKNLEKLQNQQEKLKQQLTEAEEQWIALLG